MRPPMLTTMTRNGIGGGGGGLDRLNGPKKLIEKEKTDKGVRTSRLLSSSDPTSKTTTSRMSLSTAARKRSSISSSTTPVGRPRKVPLSTRLPPIQSSPKKMSTLNPNNAKLERVLGCTSLSQTSLAVDERTGNIAYLAGASVVVQRGRNRKEGHLIGPSKSTFSCLSFSPCGQYIATGEFGHSPCVRLFELMDKSTDKWNGSQIREMTIHTFGIIAVKFSSQHNHLISVGEHHDQTICLWNWKTGEQIASSKVTAHVHAMAISPDGSHCVTVGLRHVKFWTLSDIKGKGIPGRSAILNNHRNCLFVDVSFMGDGRVLAVSENGAIAELVDRKIVRTYQLENSKIFAICVLGSRLLMGCNNGSIQSLDFSNENREVKGALCPPHYLSQDVAYVTTVDDLQNKPPGSKFADVHAICCIPSSSTVTVAYADHSIYSWQESIDGCKKVHSSLAHVGQVHALEIYPCDQPYLPSGSFFTGGADGTLRLWNIQDKGGDGDINTFKNLLSNNLKKMLVLDPEPGLVASKNSTMVPSGGDRFDSGVKCVRVSKDGRHCAVGLRNGTLIVLDITSSNMPLHFSIDAHDSDVLCLEYSPLGQECPPILASGGRDRLIHLFRIHSHYEHVYTIEDHSSSILAIKFVSSSDGFMMYSCAADKMIVIRRLVDADGLVFDRINQISCLSSSITDLHISIDCQSLLAACSDRQLRQFSLSGKLLSTVKATTDTGSAGNTSCTRMAIDHSGTFVASICSDRFVYIVEAKSGNPVAILRGFGDSASSISFSSDQRRLIVVSSNGCIYIFRLSDRIVNRIAAAKKTMVEAARTVSPDSVLGSGSETISEELPNKDSEVESSHFGSVSSLAIGDDDVESGLGSTVLITREDDEHNNISLKIRESIGGTEEEDKTFEVEEDKSYLVTSRYQSSKSMSNMIGGGGVSSSPFIVDDRSGSPRRTRRKWNDSNTSPTIPNDNFFNQDSSPFSSSLDGRMKMAPSTLPSNFQPQNRVGHRTLTEVITPSSTRSPSSSLMYSSPFAIQSSSSSSNQSSHLIPPPSLPSTSPSSSLRENLIAKKQAELAGGVNGVSNGRDTVSSSPSSIDQPSIPPLPTSFNRDSTERLSLSKRFQMRSNQPPRTAWSPSSSSSSSSISRRTTSSIGQSSSSPTGASAAAITRRQSDLFGKGVALPSSSSSTSQFHSPLVNNNNINNNVNLSIDVKGGGGGIRRSRTMGTTTGGRDPSRHREEDDSFSALRQHIRSRSQSPNQLTLQASLATSTPNALNAGGYASRRDSDASYPLSTRRTPSKSNLRGGEEMRKSSQALDKIAQTRKLRQSTENLADLDGSSPISRARSIGNLRGGQLEIGGGFDIDHNDRDREGLKPRLLGSSPLSSRISRNLARSMGQLNGDPIDSSPSRVPPTTSGLLGAMSNLKKASNPDLADESQYENRIGGGIDEYTSPILKPRRGAVQKKVERYHPRNRGSIGGSRVESGSGESDSNASDASPLHSNYSRNTSNGVTPGLHNRSLDGLRMGGRRIVDSPRLSSSNSSAMRRVPNYLAQKMQPLDDEGPDLGSDESPRSSVMNGNDWMSQFDGKSIDARKLAQHVSQCNEELMMAMTKMMHAERLVRENEDIGEDDRSALFEVIKKARDSMISKFGVDKRLEIDDKEVMMNTPSIGGGMQQTRLSSGSSHSSSFSSVHPPSSSHIDPNSYVRVDDLLTLLRHNMAKQN